MGSSSVHRSILHMARNSPARSIRPNAAVKVSSDNPEKAKTAKAAYVVAATHC